MKILPFLLVLLLVAFQGAAESGLCWRLAGMRILPVLCALLLLMFRGATGLPPVRASAQDCERRGGFCSHSSCPPGIGRVGLCSEREFCCRMRWYP
ncbi:gallinacin-5-like [Hirundo rustica]|uniref:gallinacin-5-like n=1 Tax=Hirundo rustica TaxID=43150 RepID=UPI001A952BA3|nr:gallinacin-5-like [Hirundo rustica]